MMKIFRSYKNAFLKYKFPVSIFVVLNLVFFLNILFFHSKVDFNNINYEINAHHYFQDPRINGGLFNLFRALGQFDAQWYLKIAKEGYPFNPKTASMGDATNLLMDGFTYAFFPLYPTIVGSLNILLGNVELSAFIISNTFLVLSFISLIYVVTKHFNKKVALKASFLLFFFPFSIFYRSYFAEGAFLFLLIWFTYFLLEKKYLKSSVFLSLASITKGTAFLLIPLFFYLVYSEFRRGKLLLKKFVLIIFLLLTPMIIWTIYNYIHTGNPFYFLFTRPFGGVNALTSIPFLSIFHNILTILIFPILPLHLFHLSKIDVIMILAVMYFLIKSYKVLPKAYWMVALCVWLSPLLVKDMMCYSRFQSVNFPIFIYLAHVLNGRRYLIVFTIFFFSLLVISLYFVNWWWIG